MRLGPFYILGAVAALVVFAWTAVGGEGCGCCPHCGCCETRTVCRLVPQITKVPHSEYSCKCGEICVPGKSCYVGKECTTDCDGNCHHVKVYQPTCGKVFQTVTPAKTTTFTEKCTYKCVPETVCCKCGTPYGIGMPMAPAAPAAPNGQHTDHPPHWHRSN